MIALIAILSIPLSTAFAQTTFEGKQVITAAFVSDTAPVIDGQIDPDEWSQALPIFVTFEDVFNEPGVVPLDDNGEIQPHFPPAENEADLSYTVRALYDDTNLYISVDVNDDIVIKDSGAPWQDDAVELFFDGDRTVDQTGSTLEAYQLFTDTEGNTGDSGANVDWEVAISTEKPQGFQAEIRIALASIDVIDGRDETQAPQPGDYIGFNIVVGDDDNGGGPYNGINRNQLDDPAVDGYMKWTGTGNTFDEADWGLLFFAPVGTAVEPSSWGLIKQQAK